MHVGIVNAQWRGKRSRHSRRMRNPQFYVSGMRPMEIQLCVICKIFRCTRLFPVVHIKQHPRHKFPGRFFNHIGILVKFGHRAVGTQPTKIYERFCLGISCIVNGRKYNNWVHGNYVCLLFKWTDWVVSLHNIFCRFFNVPPDFHQRNGDTRSCACYKVYGVDKLSNNSNLYKKKSTRPKLTLYLPTVEIWSRIFCDDWL